MAQWIKERAEVQLLPGRTLWCPRPGYFRMCFTAYEPGQVRRAVRAVRAALDELPGPAAGGAAGTAGTGAAAPAPEPAAP